MLTLFGVSADTWATALCNREVGISQYLASEAVLSKERPLASLTSGLLVPSVQVYILIYSCS